MSAVSFDWADKLAHKKKLRGEKVSSSDLRKEVKELCENYVNRLEGEKWKTGTEKAKVAKAEMKRLIKIREEQDLCKQLEYDYEQKGIIVQADYCQHGKIASVELPFTPEEWADLLNKEGEYLGACCADISRIRDILQAACREDYFIEVEDLYEAAFLARHHDGGEERDYTKDTDPIARMIVLWDKVKDDARSRSKGRSVNLEDPKDALDVLFQCAGNITWNEIRFNQKTEDDKFDCIKNCNRTLFTMVPAVRTLFFKMKELYKGAVEGYGLVRQDGEIGESRSGVAVYRTKKLADELCEQWNKTEEEEIRHTKSLKKRTPNVYTVKKVRVSMEKGVEIIDES